MSCSVCRKRSFIVRISAENQPIAASPGFAWIATISVCGAPSSGAAVKLRRKKMKVERHDVAARMSKVVVHGDTVYLAGIVADQPKGKSTGEQTKDILRQIDGFLAKAGTDKSKLLSTNIWITDMANFAEMNAQWDAWVSPGNTPARATVEAKLASPDYKVEIMVVAAK